MRYRVTRMTGLLSRSVVALLALSLLSACATPLPRRALDCRQAEPPRLSRSADGFTTTELSVLTYNVEGLSWPARSGRGPQLGEIGRRLAAMRAEGRAPDVVLFQEMFSGPAKKALADSGYPAIAGGPRRMTPAGPATREKLPGRTRWLLGELGLKLTSSGLAIASRYPLLDQRVEAYGRRSCAGIDCLANKGIMLVRLGIPGVPVPVDLYNTHMNARGASKAANVRNAAAHDRQALEASFFIRRTHEPAHPLVFGGDFNMRKSEERWENFSRYQSLGLVHDYCLGGAHGCDVRMSWDGDEPWMDTQDLQFFQPGDRVAIRPIRVEAMFDGGASGPELSDHDGFLVTYELRWRSDMTPADSCPAIGPALRP